MSADTQTGAIERGEVSCPLCGDYVGSPESVESHISSKVDSAHQGEVGRAYRDDLEDQLHSPDITEEDMATVDLDEGGVDGADTEESDGIPVPVSPTVIFLALIALLVLAFYLRDPADEPDEEDGDEEEAPVWE